MNVERAIEHFRSGHDREASFRLLYRRYYRSLQQFFAAKGLPPEECQDLTQETFLAVYRGLDTYQHQMRFGGWLFQLATNTFKKRIRSKQTAKRSGRETQLDETAAQPAFVQLPDQLDGVLRDEKLRTMRLAIRDLPEKMRECLTLRLYHGMSYREIAVVMKLKAETVKVHLFKARQRLREKLEGYILEDQDL